MTVARVERGESAGWRRCSTVAGSAPAPNLAGGSQGASVRAAQCYASEWSRDHWRYPSRVALHGAVRTNHADASHTEAHVSRNPRWRRADRVAPAGKLTVRKP